MSPKPGTDSLSLFPAPPAAPDYSLESRLIAGGVRHVAGTDEAGRGPLAGPVVAAAVILDAARIPPGLDDSKKLSEMRREALFGMILGSARAVAWASVSPAAIDRGNIRLASLEAMRRAVAGLDVLPCHVLCDGRDVPPGLSCPGSAIIKGDARSLSVAAASIVAKVMRDRMLARAGLAFPEYGFAGHKGYGSSAHVKAIAEHGPSPIHRLSFEPLASMGAFAETSKRGAG